MQGMPGWLRHPLEPTPQTDSLSSEILDRVPEWHRQWDEIWYVHLGGRNYVWHTPTRRQAIEFDLVSESSSFGAIDDLVSSCILYPEKLPDDMPFSHVAKLNELIWGVSGYRDAEFFSNKLDEYRQVAWSADHSNIVLLCRAFQGLLPDDINKWQPEKVIYHIALAEVLLGLTPPKQAQKPKPDASAPRRKTYNWQKDLDEWKAFERE